MNKFVKWTLIGVGGLILIGMLIPKDKPEAATTDGTINTVASSAPAAATWAEVYSFKGNGMKKSPTFMLSGSDTRIKYNYHGNSDMPSAGLFSAYVMEKGKDAMVDGAVPEVMTQQAEQSESGVTRPSGEYYLFVNAVGNWEVSIEQKQ